jgi:hypothetical protein
MSIMVKMGSPGDESSVVWRSPGISTGVNMTQMFLLLNVSNKKKLMNVNMP